MKKFCLILTFVLGMAGVSAQSITGGEWFYDTAPQLGGGNAFSVTPGTFVNHSLQIPTTSLSSGFHTLFIRVKDENGQWSQYEGRGLYIIPVYNLTPMPPVVSGEWFFDTAPELGGGTAFTVPSGSAVNHSLQIPTTSLSSGFHTLFVRVKDANGQWSQYEGRGLYVMPSDNGTVLPPLVSGEWFVDSDPGLGNGTAFSYAQGNLVTPVLNIPMSGLTSGNHNLFVRVKDTSGNWSHYESRMFTVCNGVIDLSVTQNDTLLISNATGAMYQWVDCNNNNTPISGATGQSLQTIVNGNYAVIVTQNGCASISACYTVTAHTHMAVNENTSQYKMKIYPNPVKDILHIQNEGAEVKNVKIFDINGRLLINASKAKEIDVRKLLKGNYIVIP